MVNFSNPLPTEEQKQAIIKINSFLSDRFSREFVLIGPAGSGKTFVLRYALSNLSFNNVFYCAISHAAKKVLADSLPNEANCLTVAQVIDSKPKVDEHGNEKFTSGNRRKILDNCKVLVVDECSMIDDNLKHKIIMRLSAKTKIIWVGDDRQLPPINNNQKPSSAFAIYEPNRFELINSMRFGENIGTVAKFYRDYVDYSLSCLEVNLVLDSLSSWRPTVDKQDDGVYFVSDLNSFIKSSFDFASSYGSDFRMIAFTNGAVDYWNDLIRDHIINCQDKFVADEVIILNRPYYSSDGIEVFQNSDKLLIKKVSFSSKEFETINGEYVTIKVYELFVHKNGADVLLYYPHEDNEDFFIETLTALEVFAIQANSLKIGQQLHKFKNNFIDFSYTYCQTCHKAQGQSIDHVFLLAQDIFNVDGASWTTKLKSLYVGASRARKTLCVLM